MNLNKAILVGRVATDPETRSTPSGQMVCNFRLATSRIWTVRDSGQKQEKTELPAKDVLIGQSRGMQSLENQEDGKNNQCKMSITQLTSKEITREFYKLTAQIQELRIEIRDLNMKLSAQDDKNN